MPRDHIPAVVEQRVRQAARHRCGYCLSPQRLVMARLEIEHIIPLAKGGDSAESNLWLSFPMCNASKPTEFQRETPSQGSRFPCSIQGPSVGPSIFAGRTTASASSASRRLVEPLWSYYISPTTRMRSLSVPIGCSPDGIRRPTHNRNNDRSDRHAGMA
jgi:HNH endonuclease